MDVMSDEKVNKLVATQGVTRVYEMEDGSWITARDGTVAWRNNNPGNLKFGYAGSADDSNNQMKRSREDALSAAKKEYTGVVDLDQWGNAIFESYEAGREAQKHLLLGRMKEKTVEELVLSYSTKDYSGSPHHANQVATIYNTAAAEGLDLHGKKIIDMSPAEVSALADGLAKAEGWRVGTVEKTPPLSEEQLSAVLNSQAHGTAHSHSMKPAHAYAQAYRQGDHGAAVGQLQQDLATLGVTSKDGREIEPDQRFGPRTREAVEAFQRAQGLKPDGVVGPATLAAIGQAKATAQARTPSLLEPQHPAHEMYQQAYRCVAQIDESQGRASGAYTQMFAGSLTSAAVGAGMSRIDQVLLSPDASQGFAVQGAHNSLVKQYASVDVMEAIRTPLDQSSQQAAAQMAAVQAETPPTRSMAVQAQVAGPSM